MHVLAAITDVKNLLLETRAFAFFAYQFDICQKLHLDGHRAIALANITAAAGQIKREVGWIKAACLRFACPGEYFANAVVNLDVGDRV